MVVCFIEFISYRLAEAGLARRKIIRRSHNAGDMARVYPATLQIQNTHI